MDFRHGRFIQIKTQVILWQHKNFRHVEWCYYVLTCFVFIFGFHRLYAKAFIYLFIQFMEGAYTVENVRLMGRVTLVYPS